VMGVQAIDCEDLLGNGSAVLVDTVTGLPLPVPIGIFEHDCDAEDFLQALGEDPRAMDSDVLRERALTWSRGRYLRDWSDALECLWLSVEWRSFAELHRCAERQYQRTHGGRR